MPVVIHIGWADTISDSRGAIKVWGGRYPETRGCKWMQSDDSLALVIKNHQMSLHLDDLLPLDAVEDQLPGTQIMTMRKEESRISNPTLSLLGRMPC